MSLSSRLRLGRRPAATDLCRVRAGTGGRGAVRKRNTGMICPMPVFAAILPVELLEGYFLQVRADDQCGLGNRLNVFRSQSRCDFL